MLTRQLGSSDLKITPLGIGAWAMGGAGWAFSWGHQDDADSIAAIRAGLDAGMNWIDTAAVYGLGHSEEVVAKAVEGVSPRPYVFTKCERTWDANGQIVKCLKKDSIARECEASLKRLGTDSIDLYQIHWPEPDEDLEEGWEALVRLKEAGKVRNIGVSNCNASQLARISTIQKPASLQPPYSMVTPDTEESILPYCGEHGIGTIVYSPMRNGLLSGTMTKERVATLPEDDVRRRMPPFQEPALSRNLELVEKLRAIGEKHGRTPGEVAIAWTLRRTEVTAAIVGLRNAGQLAGVLGAAEFRLSVEEIQEIDSFRTAQRVTAP
jgi:aryl-alcohol dehydrogenase-like predicted oxidoreductase